MLTTHSFIQQTFSDCYWQARLGTGPGDPERNLVLPLPGVEKPARSPYPPSPCSACPLGAGEERGETEPLCSTRQAKIRLGRASRTPQLAS